MRLTRRKAEDQGYHVDTTCYPWVAYKGPRFNPDKWVECWTTVEEQLLEALKGVMTEYDSTIESEFGNGEAAPAGWYERSYPNLVAAERLVKRLEAEQ